MYEKGQLTYSIDGDIYELPQFSGIGTSALIKNRKKIAFQLPLKNVIYLNYLLKNIKKLQKLFIKNLHNLKKKYLSHHFFFNCINNDKLDIKADLAVKIKYNKRTLIIHEDQFNNSIFMVLEGSVLCSKDD